MKEEKNLHIQRRSLRPVVTNASEIKAESQKVYTEKNYWACAFIIK